MLRALVGVDLGFGDAGKGSVVDYLARRENAGLVVFFNGGAQRAHNVVLADGRQHTFSQWGSGTFAGARTYHSEFSMVNPLNALAEARALKGKGVEDPFGLLTVDTACPIITPFQIAANRLREFSRAIHSSRHGSCGQGIGETWSDHLEHRGILARDLWSPSLRARLRDLQKRKLAQCEGLDVVGGLASVEWKVLTDPAEVDRCVEAYRLFARKRMISEDFDLHTYGETVIFEPSQGVLLDEWHGFNPFTTWSTCTTANALDLLEPYRADVTRLGIVRAYACRHGAGPLPTEADLGLVEAHNGTDPWQGAFRVGYTDLVLFGYAVAATGGVDELAVTCVDQLPQRAWKVCSGYRVGPRQRAQHWFEPNHAESLDYSEALARTLAKARPIYDPCDPEDVPAILGMAAGAPVTLLSEGPREIDKRPVALPVREPA